MAETSNLATIKTAAAALVSAADGTANVYEGSRLTHDWGSFVNQFREVDGTDARINGWTVSWVGMKELRGTSMENELEHTFKVRGYYSIRDPKQADATTSEEEFDTIILAILDEIRTTHDMSGTANLGGPGEMILKQEKVFGDVLVHYTEIMFKATEVLLGD